MNNKIFVLMASLLILIPVNVYAWEDCPFGEVNDEYPGNCARYVDTDEDGICDLSQPAPEDRELIKTTVAVTPEIREDLEYEESASDHSHDDHDEHYSVEIEGSEIKKLTIQEVAELWEIEAECLLNHTIAEFDLKNEYTKLSTVEDLRAEYKFSPAQIKDIAEKIKIGDEGELQKDFEDKHDEEQVAPTANRSTHEENGKSDMFYALLLIGLPLTVIVIYSLYQRRK
jgi:hypothetical protein